MLVSNAIINTICGSEGETSCGEVGGEPDVAEFVLVWTEP